MEHVTEMTFDHQVSANLTLQSKPAITSVKNFLITEENAQLLQFVTQQLIRHATENLRYLPSYLTLNDLHYFNEEVTKEIQTQTLMKVEELFGCNDKSAMIELGHRPQMIQGDTALFNAEEYCYRVETYDPKSFSFQDPALDRFCMIGALNNYFGRIFIRTLNDFF